MLMASLSGFIFSIHMDFEFAAAFHDAVPAMSLRAADRQQRLAFDLLDLAIRMNLVEDIGRLLTADVRSFLAKALARKGLEGLELCPFLQRLQFLRGARALPISPGLEEASAPLPQAPTSGNPMPADAAQASTPGLLAAVEHNRAPEAGNQAPSAPQQAHTAGNQASSAPRQAPSAPQRAHTAGKQAESGQPVPPEVQVDTWPQLDALRDQLEELTPHAGAGVGPKLGKGARVPAAGTEPQPGQRAGQEQQMFGPSATGVHQGVGAQPVVAGPEQESCPPGAANSRKALRVCAYCCKEGRGLKKCARCGAHFCDMVCFKQAWRDGHKQVCIAAAASGSAGVH